MTIYNKFELQYSYPQMNFDPHYILFATLNILILSGYVTAGSSENDGPINWDPPVKVDQGASISALVPLASMTGKVNPGIGDKNKVYSVVIDFSKGTFMPDNMTVNDDMDKAAFS